MAKVIARFEKVTFEQFVKDFNKQIENGELSELTGKTDLNEMYEAIVLPYRKTKGSAGHDFIAPFDIVLQPGQTIVIPTGIRCFIEPDYVLEMFPRSGQGFTYRLRFNNTAGIIDSDYYYSDNEGHIMAKLSNEGNKIFKCEKGKAFCQGLFHEYFIAEGNEDPEATRNGGIGSTDK